MSVRKKRKDYIELELEAAVTQRGMFLDGFLGMGGHVTIRPLFFVEGGIIFSNN